ncbi:Fanconi anemia group J protein [Mortierella sp. AM989]|nr:Fanconi anemia group J protein [Mortierella sp. AM989]
MSKRSRALPPTVDRTKGKGKRRSREGSSSSAVQSHLNFHTADSSDSDFSKDHPSGAIDSDCDDKDFVALGAKISDKAQASSGNFIKAEKQPKKEVSATAAAAPTEFITGGVKIMFPFKPYKSQEDMMSSIVEALQKQENALLESPTGSGKSLALLCGALAWLESQKKRPPSIQSSRGNGPVLKMEQQGIVESPYFTTETLPDETNSKFNLNASESLPDPRSCGSCSGSCSTASSTYIKDESASYASVIKEQIVHTGDNQDLQPTIESTNIQVRKAMELKYENEVLPADETKPVQHDRQPNSARSSAAIPKIYFGSRTHKQITQLVKELKSNTIYRPNIRKAMEIDLENAIVILDEAHNIEDAARDAGGLEVADEDLESGVTQFENMCDHPFLANSSRKLRNLANMFLSILKNQTNFTVKEYESSTEIWTSQEMLSSLDKFGLNRRTIQDYERACQDISRAIKERKEQKKREKESKEQKKRGKDVVDSGSSAQPHDDDPEKERKKIITASPRILRIMEGIITIVSRLFNADLDCLDDYKIALVESVARTNFNRENMGANGQESTEGGSDDDANAEPKKKKRKRSQPKWVRGMAPGSAAKKKRELKFWCLNPGVIFRPLSLKARSVILTSGTLSPMDSFASELQTSFKIQLEADHVIDKSQVWTGVLPYGPTQIKMDGTFRSAVSFSFQDELGRVVERIIETTPHGVLCFLSSYSLMDNLINRWRVTGQYERLCAIKKVLQEPRKATNKQFDKILKGFYTHISQHVTKGSNGGALLFAVFRGKCSEGIDFTDSNCRAVLAVSIPFPGLHDLKIKLKKEYNDQQSMRHRQQNHTYNQQDQLTASSSRDPVCMDLQGLSHSTGTFTQSAGKAVTISKLSQTRSLLSGRRWYEIQAFRAFNQAIGRCIRHQRDWGAMVLLDYRFTQPNNQQSLSKWVRPLVKTFGDFESGIDNMRSWIGPLYAATNSMQQVDAGSAPIETESLHIEACSVANEPPVDPVDEVGVPQETDQANNMPPFQDTSATPIQDPTIPYCAEAKADTPDLKKECFNDTMDVDESTVATIGLLEFQGQGGSQDSIYHSLSDDNEWDESWVLSPDDDLQFDGEATVPKPHYDQAISVVHQPEVDDWSPTIEAEVSADFDGNFSDNYLEDRLDDRISSGSGEIILNPPKGECITSLTSIPAPPEIRNAILGPIGIYPETNNLKSPEFEQAIAAPPRNIWSPALLQASSTFPPDVPSISQVEQNDSVSWTSISTIEHAGEALPRKHLNTHASEINTAIRVLCKACRQPLLSCSERPRIKVVRKSMASELLSNRRRAALAGTLVTAPSPLQAILSDDNIKSTLATTGTSSASKQYQGDQSQSTDNERIGATVTGAGSHTPPPAMILSVHRSHVVEMFFETQDDTDELDCVWRPRDELFYQRIVCAKCHNAAARDIQGQKIVAGWKGVLIVGRSDRRLALDGDIEEVGAIWLTPGEIMLV